MSRAAHTSAASALIQRCFGCEIRRAGRAKGQDTIEVLSSFGFAPQEIEALVADGSVQLS